MGKYFKGWNSYPLLHAIEQEIGEFDRGKTFLLRFDFFKVHFRGYKCGVTVEIVTKHLHKDNKC